MDRLLATKAYGERQAMFWLDLARMAKPKATTMTITAIFGIGVTG